MVRSRTVVVENTTVQGRAALLNQWLQNLLEQSCMRGQGEAHGPFHLSSHRDVPHSCPFQQELHAQVVDSNVCPSPFPHTHTKPCLRISPTQTPNSHANVMPTRTLGPQPCTNQMRLQGLTRVTVSLRVQGLHFS